MNRNEQEKCFDKLMVLSPGSAGTKPTLTPLSKWAWNLRRPPAINLLLDANQERPEISSSNARVARSVRVPPKTG